MSRSKIASFAVSTVQKVPAVVWAGWIVVLVVGVAALALRANYLPGS